MSDAFKPFIGKTVAFGAPNSGQYIATVREVRPSWVKFEWPNSGGLEGWRNVKGYIVHEVIEL